MHENIRIDNLETTDDIKPYEYTVKSNPRPKPLAGSNITRISQHAGIDLILNYWKHIEPTLTNHTLFVGDVHGDINQLLAPLVMSGLITLTGNITIITNEKAYKSSIFTSPDDTTTFTTPTHYDELSLYIPEYTVNTSAQSTVIYLGDMIHEWIFSRVVMYILNDLLIKLPNNVIFVYGNHDLNLLAAFPLYQRRMIDMGAFMQTTYDTMSKELSMYKSIHFYQFKIDYDGKLSKGIDFMYAYLAHLFEPIYEIFSNHRGKLCHYLSIGAVPFIVSHTVWDLKWMPAFVHDRGNGANNLQYIHHAVYNYIGGYKANQDSKTHVMGLHYSLRDTNSTSKFAIDREKLQQRVFTGVEYEQLRDAMNDLTNGLMYVALTNNVMLRNRSTDTMFVNQITGHTPGGTWREVDINVGQSIFYEERLAKLTPEEHNNKYIYYWDFNASAGYVVEEFSRPDFVYVSNDIVNIQGVEIKDDNEIGDDVFQITNLPSFNYIMSNGKDSMMVCDKKSKHVGPHKKIVMDSTSSESD